MTHWLAHVPYMPAWAGWSTMQQLAEGGPLW